jgi:hypothetical protein
MDPSSSMSGYLISSLKTGEYVCERIELIGRHAQQQTAHQKIPFWRIDKSGTLGIMPCLLVRGFGYPCGRGYRKGVLSSPQSIRPNSGV